MTIHQSIARTTAAVTLALLTTVASCGIAPSPAAAQTAPPPDPSVPAAGVPVGRLVINAVDPARSNRPVTIDFWYPATTATSDQDMIDLEYTQLATGAYSNAPFQTGPFPLVMFSHATYSDRFQSFEQMETIASHGFIVAAPSHEGHTLSNEVRGTTVPFAQSMNERLADMQFTKTLLAGNDFGAGGILQSRIQFDTVGNPRMATMGHSLGAVTALQMSDHDVNDTGWGVNAAKDPDVDAVIAVAPALQFWTPDTGDSVPDEDPMLQITGDLDDIATPAIRQQLWDSWDTLQKFRVDILNANHASPSSGCQILDALAIALWNDPTNTELAKAVQVLSDRMDGACTATPDRYQVNRTVQAFAVPFLQRVLKNDGTYETWLSRARSNRTTLAPNNFWRCTASAGTCDSVPS